MNRLKIPALDSNPVEPSQLTTIEIANLTAAKRNTVQYEARLAELSQQVSQLSLLLESEKIEKERIYNKCSDLELDARAVERLKHEKELAKQSFRWCTVFTVLGGGLISSHPNFGKLLGLGAGWTMMIVAAFMHFINHAKTTR